MGCGGSAASDRRADSGPRSGAAADGTPKGGAAAAAATSAGRSTPVGGPKPGVTALRKARLTLAALDAMHPSDVEAGRRRELYEQASAHGSRRESGPSVHDSVVGFGTSFRATVAGTMGGIVPFRPSGAGIVVDESETSSMYSFSDAEVELSADELLGFATKKHMRPHSAKGFSCPEPNAFAMEEKCRAVALRGLLSGVDGLVEPGSLLRVPNWATMLALHCVTRQQRRGHGSLLAAARRSSRGLLAAAAAAMENGEGDGGNGLVASSSVLLDEDDSERVACFLDLLAVDPNEADDDGREHAGDASRRESALERESGVGSEEAGRGMAVSPETHALTLFSKSDAEIGKGRYDLLTTAERVATLDALRAIVGKAAFAAHGSTRTYVWTVEPWVLEYLLGNAVCDTSLDPSPPVIELLPIPGMTKPFDSSQVLTPGTLSRIGLSANCSVTDGSHAPATLYPLPSPPAAKSQHDDEVMQMMLS